MPRLHAWVRGKVQGVWFRKNTLLEANKLGGITGWCKNLPDGRVEVIAESTDKTKLEALLKWLNVGPRLSRVVEVEFNYDEAATGEFTNFRILQ